MVEYRSRDVTIAGAVKTPTTIQEFGNLRVLDALGQAGGLLPEAGPKIIVEQADGSSQRMSVRKLFDGLHPELNIPVAAGAQIRVPECEQRICRRRREAAGSVSLSRYAGHHRAQVAGVERRS